VRFFGISQHISGMADIRGLLAAIDPAHTLDDLTLSAHNWVMDRPPDRVPMLERGGWQAVLRDRSWAPFHAAWRDRLDAYDAFICFHPVAFVYLYRHFDKPIICQCSTRYELPWHADAARWQEFKADLRGGIDAGRILLCANNPYDAAYTELFVERPVPFVPSICGYTSVEWQPATASVAYYCAQQAAELDHAPFVHQRTALPRGHSWRDVASHQAIAHFPYNVSTMSIIEQYTMGIPLLFPTLDFAVSLFAAGARLFEQNSWAGVGGGAPGSPVVPRGGFPDGHDPNDFASVESLRYWLRYADYYDERSMPGVGHFASFEELTTLARDTEALRAVHERMRAGLPARRDLAVDGWRRMLAAL
jgi:hypothetical protein